MYIGKFYPTHSKLNDGSEIFYEILILTDDTTPVGIPLTMASEPVIIKQEESEYFLGPIKFDSATIRIVTEKPLFDIYSSTATGTTVKVILYTFKNYTMTNKKIVFDGYVTPNLYDLEFVYKDVVEIECIGKLSTLKYQDYEPLGGVGKESLVLISEVMKNCLHRIGIDKYNFTSSYICNGTNAPEYHTLYIDENNFFDDLNHDPMNLEEVLSEILNFYGLCAFYYDDTVYIVDNYNLDVPDNVFMYNNGVLDYGDSNYNRNLYVSKDLIRGNSHKISLDETYNKISITANTYVLEDSKVSPDLYNKNNISNILDLEQDLSHLTASDKDYYYYIKPYNNKDVKTTFYKAEVSKAVLAETKSIEEEGRDPIGTTRTWSNLTFSYNKLNEWAFDDPNTIGATLILTATKSKSTSGDLSDWEMYYSLHVYPQNNEYANYYTVYSGPEYPSGLGIGLIGVKQYLDVLKLAERTRNQCIFKYTSPVYNSLVKDNSSTTYLVLSGSIKLSNTSYDSKTAKSQKIKFTKNSKNAYNLLRAKLKIGSKYWNGNSWTYEDSFFNLSFGTSGSDLNIEEWIKFTKQDTGFSLVENEGNIIPIKASDALTGSITLELYPLIFDESLSYKYGNNIANFYTGAWYNICYLQGYSDEQDRDTTRYTSFTALCSSPLLHDAYISTYNNLFYDYPYTEKVINYETVVNIESDILPPFILLKDMKISLETNVGNFFDNNAEAPIDDTEYFNVVNKDFVNEMSTIKLKINTLNTEKKVSLSSVIFNPGNYSGKPKPLETLKDKALDTDYRIQEYNLVDRYYQHYYIPKKILNMQIAGYGFAGNYAYYNSQFKYVKFIIASLTWDLESDVNNIKLIQL